MLHTVLERLCLVCCAFQWISAVEIDNGLVGNPTVNCEQDRIAATFTTRQPFRGNIYAKGFFNNQNCRLGASNRLDASIVLAFEAECGLRRRRSTSPPGLILEGTVVIMFHNQFLTKIDRAFKIECFYMEANIGETLTQQLEVSMIPTTSINAGSTTMPQCTYQVLQGNTPSGLPIQFATIGMPVYHSWRCAGGTDDNFCMTVHSCSVDDGQGRSQVLIDANGCGTDRYLLQNLIYQGSLVAGQESHVFKFADRPSVYFNCQIRLTSKQPGQPCIRSSDNCPSPPGFAANVDTRPSVGGPGSPGPIGGGGSNSIGGGGGGSVGTIPDNRFVVETGGSRGNNNIGGQRPFQPNIGGGVGGAGSYSAGGSAGSYASTGGFPASSFVGGGGSSAAFNNRFQPSGNGPENTGGYLTDRTGAFLSSAGPPRVRIRPASQVSGRGGLSPRNSNAIRSLGNRDYSSGYTRKRDETLIFPTPAPFLATRYGIYRRSAPFLRRLKNASNGDNEEGRRQLSVPKLPVTQPMTDAEDQWSMDVDVSSNQIDILAIKNKKEIMKLDADEAEEVVRDVSDAALREGFAPDATCRKGGDSFCVSRTWVGVLLASALAFVLIVTGFVCQSDSAARTTHQSPDRHS